MPSLVATTSALARQRVCARTTFAPIFVWNNFGGGAPYPIFFCENLLVRVKLGHPLNFNFLGKPLLVEKYVHGRKRRKKEERKNNNAKFSGHYVYPRTETVRAHPLCSHQKNAKFSGHYFHPRTHSERALLLSLSVSQMAIPWPSLSASSGTVAYSVCSVFE